MVRDRKSALSLSIGSNDKSTWLRNGHDNESDHKRGLEGTKGGWGERNVANMSLLTLYSARVFANFTSEEEKIGTLVAVPDIGGVGHQCRGICVLLVYAHVEKQGRGAAAETEAEFRGRKGRERGETGVISRVARSEGGFWRVLDENDRPVGR